MTLYRARVADTPGSPFAGGGLRADDDAGLLVTGGAIADRGPFASVQARYPSEPVVDLRAGLLLPGLVDTHTHYPQLRAIGDLGLPLLDWLERCALPEEARLADTGYARAVAAEFTRALADAGTTSALVFGAHFAPAVEELFAAAHATGLRITAGLVVSDRLLRPELHTTPERGYAEGRALAGRWHGAGRLRYAVTPRFALSCGEEMLAACRQLHADLPGSLLTAHINEHPSEIAKVRELTGVGYLDSYDRHGLVGKRSVFAHNVHAPDAELDGLAATGAAVAHCPTSNCALGSGLFPLKAHLARGVPVALGSDVGAGTGFSMLSEALQAYFVQRMRGADGAELGPAHLLYLATAAGARALGLGELTGDLSAGKRFDAVWVRPPAGTPLDIGLRHASDAEAAVSRLFALATPRDIAAVWVDGTLVKEAWVKEAPVKEARAKEAPVKEARYE
ncbi:MAG: guanine deaminase [Nocardiopsaceae bacterium]|nr:guanine deaminase [Nocardiopsaceae bacterium]